MEDWIDKEKLDLIVRFHDKGLNLKYPDPDEIGEIPHSINEILDQVSKVYTKNFPAFLGTGIENTKKLIDVLEDIQAGVQHIEYHIEVLNTICDNLINFLEKKIQL